VTAVRESCDVLVVGGGPAGSSCARELVRAGLDVVVLDRKRFPRDKVCAGWITPPVLDCLGIEPDTYARSGRVLEPIRGFAVSRLGSTQTRVDYGAVISYAIRRCELDHFLLERAGARLRLGEPLRELRREAGRFVANDRVAARIVVGAGGHFCPVAQRLRHGPEPVVTAQEVEVRLPIDELAKLDVAPSLPELFFEPDLAGYGWVVRKGAWLNVGLGRQDANGHLAAHVARFVARVQALGKLPASIDARFRGHAYLLHGEARRPLVSDGALLVGDAAGLAYPRSGEGIRPAVESGILAARAIVDAAGNPARLASYVDRVEARFGPREPRARAASTRWVPRAWKPALAGALLANRSFARRVVLDRWFLHRGERALEAV
jgi:geranylgeranyl reductase family protein